VRQITVQRDRSQTVSVAAKEIRRFVGDTGKHEKGPHPRRQPEEIQVTRAKRAHAASVELRYERIGQLSLRALGQHAPGGMRGAPAHALVGMP
jgi:hypothetical protein